MTERKREGGTMRRIILILVAGAALMVAAPASAGGYTDMFTINNAVETNGILYQGRKVAVDSALCIGLRRYGVKKVGYNEVFTRFKCSLSGADDHFYSVTLRMLTNTRYQWLTVRRMF
jgi:hypothetical protein